MKNAKKMCLTIHCDNESVVNMTASPEEATADLDVFLQLQWVLQALQHCLVIEFCHVKGHQQLTTDSPCEVRLNHWCNTAAKQQASAMNEFESQQHLHFPAARVTLSKDGSVGRAFTPWFRENLTRQALQAYWQRKYEWNDLTMEYIDWPAYEWAHRNLSPGQKTTMIKFRTRWIATRSRLFLLQESPTAICPSCQQHEETWDHLLRCPSMVGAHAELFHSLQKWMRDNNTPLKLHLLLVHKLRQTLGLHSTGPPDFHNTSSLLKQVHEQQQSIGWSNLFCGFVTRSLTKYMDVQLSLEENASGSQWVHGLLNLLQQWVASVWVRRCKLEHNKHREEQSATRQQLLQRIAQVYSVRHKVPFSFQKCFDTPLQTFPQKSDNFLFNWLGLHEEVILNAATEPLTQSCMLDFFPPQSCLPAE